ncbi:MAG: hypothetical protein WBH00_13155 [Xanthobacteraceae bacterium]
MTSETMDRAVDVFGTMFAKIADEHAATAARIGIHAINQIVESADIEAATALYRFRHRVSPADYFALQVMARKVIEARIEAWRAAGWKKPKDGVR